MNRHLAIALLTSFVFLVVCTFGQNQSTAWENTTLAKKPQTYTLEALEAVSSHQVFDFAQLQNTYKFIDSRFDTSDFHLQSLLRMMYAYNDALPTAERERIKETLLNFRYWMDQPGQDSMCFWSENHQILFATAEYLAGQRWPNETFITSGKTGAEHRELARRRILIWLEQRWLYGFTEWYSNVYYVEDIAALSNLIDFAEDKEIVNKATIIMDLLLHDLATQSHRGVFISTSGRLYEGHKKYHNGNSMRMVSEHIWGKGTFGYETSPKLGLDLNFILCQNYEVPEVIRSIGLNTSPCVIKASNGLNLCELHSEGLLGQDTRQIMMQWAMEAFTNPEVIQNSMTYIKKQDLLSNDFLKGFNKINMDLLETLDLLPGISQTLQPISNGAAIQRANTYTYHTPDYMIATAQAYHPGTCGSQHHIWAATLSEEVSLFTTHPAKPLAVEGPLSKSPSYWIGNGRMPHSVQHKNIVLSLYQIPKDPTFLETTILDFTHAYFPEEKLEDVRIEGRYAFARHRNVLVAFIGRYPLAYAKDCRDDLIQPGRESYWIFEASTLDKEKSMDAFMARIRGNSVRYDDRTLQYDSGGGNSLRVTFDGPFLVNNKVIDTEYQRFDSPYATVPRKPQTIKITHGRHSLELDFYNQKRESN